MNRARIETASLALLATLALGCPSSGGGGGGGGGSLGISGEISVLAPLAEREPNGALDTAQLLGELRPGSTLTVVGEVGQGGDSLDAFRVNAPERVRVVATLHFAIGLGPGDQDFDLGVFSPVGTQQVAAFDSAAVPETGSFAVKGSFVVEVLPFAGEGVYSLTLDAVPLSAAVAEVEPNDEHAQAQYIGELVEDDELTISGEADSDGDRSDRFLIACPEDVQLDLSLSFPGGADFDLAIFDATVDLGAPTFALAFEGDEFVNPEVGSIEVDGMTLIQVEVFAFDGAGDYTLSISGSAIPPTPLAHGLGGPRVAGPLFSGRLARTELEARRLRGLHAGAFGLARHLQQAPGELIVRPRPTRDLRQRLARRGMRVLGEMPNGTLRVGFDLPLGLSREDQARYTLGVIWSLDACAEVEWSVPNDYYQACETLPDDVYFPLQWHYRQIQLPATWDLSTGNNNVIVAVLDTGETQHPDLVARQIQGFDMISEAANAGDGDGVDGNPADIGDNSDGHSGPGASSFHGTHVAGTIGASTDNGAGVAGVTWFAQIMHVRVLGLQGGSNWDIAQGILYAARLPNASGELPATRADVINMSLGGPGNPSAPSVVKDAIRDAWNAGVLIVAAAGNNNSAADFTPAAYDKVISVSAVDLAGAKAPYSNFHPSVDLAAPGGNVAADLNGDGNPDGVLSTLKRDDVSPPQFTYGFYQGTSMAAPHVAGVAALMLSVNPALTPAQVENFLTQTASDLGPAGRDDIFGYGLVNAFAAVSLALDGAPTNPVLGLSTQTVAFDPNDASLSVDVSNFGGDVLAVDAPSVATADGGDWLSATRVAATPGATDTSAIRIEVDRSGLADGTYAGTVGLTTNGGSATISVSLLVSSLLGGASLDIFVLAIDPLTFETVDEATLNTTGELAYAFRDLPEGEYYVVAGSDVDLDNFICDEGEPFCGVYPSLDQPGLLVLVDGGGKLRDIDFPVQSVFTALGAAPAGGFQRLAR